MRLLLSLSMAACAVGCAHAAGASIADPMLRETLPRMREALTADLDGETVVLEYEVRSHDGTWKHEVVVGADVFAERRTHEAHQSYVIGADRFGPWLAVGEGPVRVADTGWSRVARTEEALFAMRYLDPEGAEEALAFARGDGGVDYVYRPRGGRTIVLTVADDGDHAEPTAFDYVDETERLVVCNDLRFEEIGGGRRVLAEMVCSAVNGPGHRALASHHRLRSAAVVARAPTWAAPETGRSVAPCIARPVEIGMTDELAIHLSVETPRAGTRPFLLDSGAWHTMIDADVAREMGVVPTGEVPMYSSPPWIPAGTQWMGVVDRMTVAGVHLDGMRVLVQEGLAQGIEAGGLLGADFFRRFVVDVDSPARVVRLVPRGDFARAEGSSYLFLAGRGRGARVRGTIRGVESGEIILDTGAPVHAVVHSVHVGSTRPRHRGTDIGPVVEDGARTADYLTDIEGVELGPFIFPRMPAWGRDRERERLGDGIALVGMGTMRNLRLAFDFRDRALYASQGPGLVALVRSGLELDDDEDGARVSYVVPGSRADARGVRVGDVLVDIDHTRVANAARARARLADHTGAATRLTFVRNGARRRTLVALREPPVAVDPLAFPPSPAVSGVVGSACAEIRRTSR